MEEDVYVEKYNYLLIEALNAALTLRRFSEEFNKKPIAKEQAKKYTIPVLHEIFDKITNGDLLQLLPTVEEHGVLIDMISAEQT